MLIHLSIPRCMYLHADIFMLHSIPWLRTIFVHFKNPFKLFVTLWYKFIINFEIYTSPNIFCRNIALSLHLSMLYGLFFLSPPPHPLDLTLRTSLSYNLTLSQAELSFQSVLYL